MVLDQAPQRRSVGGHRVLLIRSDNLVRLGSREVILRKVEVHLIAVEIRVVRLAVGVVHANRALAGKHLGGVRHDARFVQSGLPVHQEDVAVAEVPVHLLGQRAGTLTALGVRRGGGRLDLVPFVGDGSVGSDPGGGGGGGAADRRGRRQQRLGDRRALLRGEPVEVDDAAAFVLDGVRARVNLRAVLHQFAHQLDVMFRDVLRKSQLLREHRRNSNLGRLQVRVRHDHRSRGVVHALPHHVHAEQTLLLLELLPDPRHPRLARSFPG